VDLEDCEVGGAGCGEGEALFEGDEEFVADVGAAGEAGALEQSLAPALAAGLVGGALVEQGDDGEADRREMVACEAEAAGVVVELKGGEGGQHRAKDRVGGGVVPGAQLGALQEERVVKAGGAAAVDPGRDGAFVGDGRHGFRPRRGSP